MKLSAALAVVLLAAPPALAETTPCHEMLDDALAAIALTREDLHFRTDYADHPDSFRISVVDSLLENPLDTEHYVWALSNRLGSGWCLRCLIATCAGELDLAVSASDGEDPVGAAAGPDALPSDPKPTGPDIVAALLPAIERAAAEIERAFAGLTEDERAFVRAHAPVLLEEDEFDPDKPIDEKEREEKEEEELGDRLLEIAGRVDYEALARAGVIAAGAVDRALFHIDDWSSPEDHARSGRVALASRVATGDVLSVIETEAGLAVIGGPGRTVYEVPCAITIDLGGDDEYRAGAGGATPMLPVSIAIDIDGDDRYEGGNHALGAGFMGAGVLVDLAGDDAYTAVDFSIGSGLFGVGLLHDRDGNDRYVGDTCAQGSGAFGIGVAIDHAGNDTYHAALFSQAFGFVMGVGVLYDWDGNDLYFAGGKYTDEIRYFDHFLSLSQGFGFGWRPDASGGIGLLVDEFGNDVYVSDIFGQGSSYWFSVGGLVDNFGNDQYISYQYAQGAGTHITVAALVDFDGDDNYVSKGVSQGCGHDLAIGILHDHNGDDNYTCHDLSQAAGNANGIGVLFDDRGDDVYSVRGVGNTHGYGNWRRDYGSIGVFIDAAGSDSYSGRGEDGAWWTHSTYGIGVDARAEEGAEQP